jgi:hypothetical protein
MKTPTVDSIGPTGKMAVFPPRNTLHENGHVLAHMPVFALCDRDHKNSSPRANALFRLAGYLTRRTAHNSRT